MVRSKGEAGTGDVSNAVTHMRKILGEIRHELPVTIFRDDARPRAPFVVLGHGRATSAAANAALGQARYTPNSRHLVSLGFAVFVPTRGFAVDLGNQRPSEAREIALWRAGRFEVECVPHGDMKLVVEVR